MLTLVEFLTTHTFRTIAIGCTLIGWLAGSMGCFIYLSKRTLMSDVIGHAATPGVMLGFLFGSVVLHVDGRSLWIIVLGACLSGALAAVTADRIAVTTRVGIDAAMAVMLALFFGAGLVLLRMIERSNVRHRGGLKDYFFGNASLLTTADVRTVALLAIVMTAALIVGYRALAVHTIDPVAGSVAGVNARVVSPLIMMGTAVSVVVGVSAMGLILMVALAAIPPAAARQFTKHLHTMVALSGAIGACGALIGCYLSVMGGKLPTGPVIVLTLSVILAVSLLVAPGRSVLARRPA